jgi:hypothetical protein
MMTDIEALLSVDAGKTPPGVVAFFMGDPDRDVRHVWLVIAALAGLAAAGTACAGAALLPVTVLVLATGLFGVLATPTLRTDGHQTIKRQVMVVTSEGLIVRDAWGLHSWRLDDLADVVPGIYDCRAYLDIIERNGTRHTIETIGFRRGDRIRQVIAKRLRLRQTPVV